MLYNANMEANEHATFHKSPSRRTHKFTAHMTPKRRLLCIKKRGPDRIVHWPLASVYEDADGVYADEALIGPCGWWALWAMALDISTLARSVCTL